MILEMRKNGKPLRKTHSLSLCMHLRREKHIFSSRSCCIRTVAFLWDFRTQQRGSWESRVASTCANAEPAQFSDPISISFIRCFCLRVRQQMLQQLSTEREDSYTKREKFFLLLFLVSCDQRDSSDCGSRWVFFCDWTEQQQQQQMWWNDNAERGKKKGRKFPEEAWNFTKKTSKFYHMEERRKRKKLKWHEFQRWLIKFRSELNDRSKWDEITKWKRSKNKNTKYPRKIKSEAFLWNLANFHLLTRIFPTELSGRSKRRLRQPATDNHWWCWWR